MYHTRAFGSGQKQASRLAHQLRRGLATAPDAADVAQARKYCLNQLQCVRFYTFLCTSLCSFVLCIKHATDGWLGMATMRHISSATLFLGRPGMPMMPSGR